MQVKGILIISTFRKFQKNVLMHHPSIKKSLAWVRPGFNLARIPCTEHHNSNHFSLYYSQVINYGATWYGKRLFSYAYNGKQLAGKM